MIDDESPATVGSPGTTAEGAAEPTPGHGGAAGPTPEHVGAMDTDVGQGSADRVRGRRADRTSAAHGRRERLEAARLYVCTDLSRGLEGLLDFAEAAFRGGVDILQVRDKSAEARAEVEALRALRPLADAHGALLAANDRADVAVLSGADILHLGQGDLSTADARALVGSDVLLGRSTRTPEQMRAAHDDEGIDYFCTGPVWETPTKPGREAVGLELPRAAAELTASAAATSGADVAEEPSGSVVAADPSGSVVASSGSGTATSGWGTQPKPFFAIGGIDLGRVPEVLSSGARRIVVVRAVTEAEDPEVAARALRTAVTGATGVTGVTGVTG